jgi:hypothetical protein
MRFALGAAGAEWEDVFVRSRPEMVQLLGDEALLFQQLPMLEVGRGAAFLSVLSLTVYSLLPTIQPSTQS